MSQNRGGDSLAAQKITDKRFERRAASKDITGQRFHKLTALWPAGYQQRKDHGGVRVVWLCACDCGNIKNICEHELLRPLKRAQRSCGCARFNPDAAFQSLFSQYRHKAKARGYEWGLSLEQFKEIIVCPCHYTGRLPQQSVWARLHKLTYNGIDRVNNTLGYIEGNCVPCFGPVNKAKSSMSKEDFISMCTDVARLHSGESK
jgi:hypothetical protein